MEWDFIKYLKKCPQYKSEYIAHLEQHLERVDEATVMPHISLSQNYLLTLISLII
jgi:hypothetical protein